MSENAPAQPDEAEREALASWFILRADRFDPAMLAGMTRGAAGCPFAVEHGDNHEFVSMQRDVFLKLLKSASQPQMQPETFTREP
jgi:hypothetical protein